VLELAAEEPMPDKHLSDPIIDELRAVRMRISARFGHDPKKLVERYIELQKRHSERLIDSLQGVENRSEVASHH
jgi:hypothetical protein